MKQKAKKQQAMLKKVEEQMLQKDDELQKRLVNIHQISNISLPGVPYLVILIWTKPVVCYFTVFHTSGSFQTGSLKMLRKIAFS